MVPLSLMARLTEAVRSDARLILVGDPEQLASVEAGAVLGDIVGPAIDGMRMSPATSRAMTELTGFGLPTSPAAGQRPGRRGHHAANQPPVPRRVWPSSPTRCGGVPPTKRWKCWDQVKQASPGCLLMWLTTRSGPIGPTPPAIRDAAVAAGAALLSAALDGDAADGGGRARPGSESSAPTGTGLRAFRCGRSGSKNCWPQSVAGFAIDGEWYPGRPVMVTSNDYGLRLFNGDTGATVVRSDGGLAVAFRRGGSVVSVSPSRLAAVETVFAVTVHKAQGSEFGRVAVILPPAGSPILTRELLYTAVTRAQDELILAGSEESLRAGLARPVSPERRD